MRSRVSIDEKSIFFFALRWKLLFSDLLEETIEAPCIENADTPWNRAITAKRKVAMERAMVNDIEIQILFMMNVVTRSRAKAETFRL